MKVWKKWKSGDVPVDLEEESYLEILKTRYAKGKITKEEYEEMKKTLKED